MASLDLPIAQGQYNEGTVFEITCTGGGGVGVAGWSFGTDRIGVAGYGVQGRSDVGTGVWGFSESSIGVWGWSVAGTGVYGSSNNADGVLGLSQSQEHAGVSAWNESGGPTAFGVWARGSPAGYFETIYVEDGTNTRGDTDALYATTSSPNHAGISANNTSQSGYALWAVANATAIYARGNPAGYFDGDVQITGDLTQGGNITLTGGIVNLTNNGDIQFSDCAEEFDVVSAGKTEPGTVMVIDDAGVLRPAERPYDKRVAGVISGAGNCRPAIVLNRQHTKLERAPLALFGAVYCKVDGQYGPIGVGDLLTTSPTLGHAMKAADPHRAFGAVIGKALRALEAGKGLIPVLVGLQ